MTIWKYPVDITDAFSMMMPKGAQVLSVQMQHGTPQMWALAEEKNPSEIRHFRVIGTGHPVPDADTLRFVGTFQVAGGALVFHLFEVIR